MIEAVTKLDEKAITALSKQTAKYMLFLMSVVAAVFAILGVVLIIAEYDIVVCIALIVSGAVVPFFIFFLTLINAPKNIVKKNPHLLSTVQTFIFGEKVILNEKSDTSNVENAEFEWRTFFKAGETGEYYFLYINKFTAYIIDKKGFVQGSATEFHNLLIEKLNEKYKFNKKLH